MVGVVDDEIARSAELVLRGADAGAGRGSTRQLLVATTRPERLARALPEDRLTRIGEAFAPPSGGRGGVARALEVKAAFGEFAVRLPYGEDWIGIDPAGCGATSSPAPCRSSARSPATARSSRPLRRALASLRRRGLSRLVDPGDYAGCLAPRRIPGSGSLSLHAWGLAIDINASANPQFAARARTARLVRAMERAGFTWGGRWPTAPDPMHFELHGDEPE